MYWLHSTASSLYNVDTASGNLSGQGKKKKLSGVQLKPPGELFKFVDLSSFKR